MKRRDFTCLCATAEHGRSTEGILKGGRGWQLTCDADWSTSGLVY
jgi:hypothetical protein